jgi:hypothetical protein
MPPATPTRVAATPAVQPPPRPAPGVPSGSPALASDPGTVEPQRAPAGQNWQDVALPLRKQPNGFVFHVLADAS